MLPTTDFTGFWRWLVPRKWGAASARAETAAWRTFEGPAPKRPSVGRRLSGIVMSGVSVTYAIMAPMALQTETGTGGPPPERRISLRNCCSFPLGHIGRGCQGEGAPGPG